MKKILLLLTLCASTAFAQVSNRVSLELGTVTVWLGMEKAAVKQQVEARGMNFDESSPNNVIVADIQAKRVFTLQFVHDKLVYADRNWLHDESMALPSVMDALAALIDQGATNCTIAHAPMTSPDAKMNRVFINCGQRGILLTYGSTTIVGQSYTDNAISERIGTYH
ncbi:MAG: hypothetical protein P4N24_03030 [Acidobacteriota bacterium]|nr:hypothetical protein [Acidobacteriota bacterium]